MQTYTYTSDPESGAIERHPETLYTKTYEDVARLMQRGKPWFAALEEAVQAEALAPILANEERWIELQSKEELTVEESDEIDALDHLYGNLGTENYTRPEPTIDLTNAKAVVQANLEALRLNYLEAGCPVLDGSFVMDCGEKDCNRIANAKALLEAPEATEAEVGAKDNTTHTVTLAEFQQIFTEMGQHYQGSFIKKWAARAVVAGATELAELDVSIE